jgi:hypothetical protein
MSLTLLEVTQFIFQQYSVAQDYAFLRPHGQCSVTEIPGAPPVAQLAIQGCVSPEGQGQSVAAMQLLRQL